MNEGVDALEERVEPKSFATDVARYLVMNKGDKTTKTFFHSHSLHANDEMFCCDAETIDFRWSVRITV